MRLYKLFIFAFFFFSSDSLYAQLLFNINRLQDGDSATSVPWGYSITDVEKDTIKLNVGVISGPFPGGLAKSVVHNLVNDTSYLLFNRIDGTIQNSEYYPIPASFITLNDSIYILATNYSHRTASVQDTVKVGLIYMNKIGDTLFSKWFGSSVKFIINGFVRLDSNLFLLGRFFDNSTGHNKAYIVKTDLSGNLIWTKTLFSNSSYSNISGGICKISDKGYFVSGIYNAYDVGPVHYGDCGLYRLDTNGNVMWYKKLFNNYFGGCFKVYEDKANNYFLSGNLDTLINTTDYPHSGYITKIDSSANIIWLHVFNEIPHILKNMWQYRVLPDGDLIFCGERLEAIGTGVHLGWLCRMDSTGQIKWEHFYKQNDSSEYNCLAEVQQMPDGGFIATGTCRDSLTKKQAIWLIRTDSNGCLIPGCVAPAAVEVFPETTMRITLYPNPSTGNFTLDYSIPIPEEGIVRIIDITGKVVHTQHVRRGSYKTLVSLRQALGVYHVQLTGEKGDRLYAGKVLVE